MNPHRNIRAAANALLIGVPYLMLVVGFAALSAPAGRTIDMHAATAESGGWSPANFSVRAGEPLHIRLTSADMPHGFAIGQMDIPPVDVLPGRQSSFDVTFRKAGTYVFYCTVWCGPGHWRMRGTIQVVAPLLYERGGSAAATAVTTRYVKMGIDIDAAHPAANVPAGRPSATRGAGLGIVLPPAYRSPEYYQTNSPAQAWQNLRQLQATQNLSDSDIWDLVASIWRANTSASALVNGRQLYSANCAACHGNDGIPVGSPAGSFSNTLPAPANFTDAKAMLGASPALLEGKIIRGGMGTGMPYWGPIFTDAQIRDIVAYLWTFQMEYQTKP